ncbi:MFS transporter permease [Acinetobacter proteolyticus]|uniref:MFS transporter permease n=1 Tax=Acinetobacter proteolyticus TaxID=1776741 RepID=A0A653JZM8_9GAMM|nr:MFS transporter [Acinetobacter proteolyticus]VXA53856.1 MFS transporter permease [Acinetobacter proteolyticus]
MRQESVAQLELGQLRFVFGFIGLALCAGLGIGIAKIVSSLYAVQLQANEFEMGLIAAVQSLGILLFGLPIGLLVQRHGPKKMFALGSFCAAVVYVTVPFYPTVWYLIFATFLVGLCMPMRFVSLNTVYMQHLKSIGAAKAGWFRGTHMMGFFLVGPLMAVSLVNGSGFSGAFGWIAVLFLLPVLFAPLAFDRNSSSSNSTQQKEALNISVIAKQLVLLKQDQTLRRTSLIEMASNAVMAYYGFFIIVIAIKDYGWSETIAASLVTLQGAVFVVALFTTGTLLARWGIKRFYQTGFAFVAVASVMLGIPKISVLLWVGAVILGLGLAMLHIVNFTMFANVGERLGMAKVSGLTAMAGPAGALLGSMVGGWLGHYWGLQSMFLIAAVLFVGLIGFAQQLTQVFIAPPVEIEMYSEIEGQ